MIIFIGVAGAGKSLQGQMLAKDLNCDWISTGNLFREAMKNEKYNRLNTGQLIDDDETIKIVSKNIEKYGHNKEFILDGFPRTVNQANWLVEQIKKDKYKVTLIINLEASLDVVRQRLLKRGRDDDQDQIIEKRFDEYEKKTRPILDIYNKSKMLVVDIDANRTPEEVHSEIIKHLG